MKNPDDQLPRQPRTQKEAVPVKPKTPRLRKSKPLSNDWAAGDGAKYLSYREAWARIKMASKQGYFLEAVTIEESIVSDRLLSYLEKTCELTLTSRTRGILQQVMDMWLKQAKERSELVEQAQEACDLHARLNAWRDHRNLVVHGMVKSVAIKGDDHIDNFLVGAAAAAKEGQEVARALSKWVDDAKKRTLGKSKELPDV